MINRNEAHFMNVPGNYIPHSGFDLSHDSLTSFDVGQLIPLTEPIEILPTDSFRVGISSEVQLNTLMFPIMDQLFMDVFEFYVPMRLLWEHFTNFEGENDTTPWESPTTYSMPQIESPDNGWAVGTIADYMGVPTGVNFKGEHSINALRFRGYAKIVKDWFYDENVQTPPDFVIDDATITGSNGSDYVTDLIKGGMPFVVGKTHDIFTSCLPAPQKGPSVVLPLGDNAPVYSSTDIIPFNKMKDYGGAAMRFAQQISAADTDYIVPSEGNVAIKSQSGALGFSASTIAGSVPNIQSINQFSDLSGATATTVNDLRVAFQTQRLFELMARSGSNRYYEILASQWGVSAPAGLIQRSEYLGGHRFPLKIHTSVQNSATNDVTPQANLAGYSITNNYKFDFSKGFSERGYLFILGCVRYHHSYSQGLSKSFKRKDRFDFYTNAFAHIGEQPVYNREIYAQGNDTDKGVFGYNEYGVDYRYKANMVTGQMRPTYNESLDYMHLGDHFNELPTLSSDFIKEDKINVDRVIAVSSRLTNQLRANFHFEIKAIRPMPTFAIPGLIDHL